MYGFVILMFLATASAQYLGPGPVFPAMRRHVNCFNSPCMNGGVCYDIPGGFMCRCPPGYSGPTCLFPQPPCDPYPCMNGGLCYIMDERTVCQCPPQFKGEFCQLDNTMNLPIVFRQPDVCRSSPCMNGGYCRFGLIDGQYICQCYPGFSGLRCEIPPPCRCQNGGSCVNAINQRPVCQCPAGVTGAFCEKVITVPPTLPVPVCMPPCQNGQCVVENGNASCKCATGFSGVACEIPC